MARMGRRLTIGGAGPLTGDDQVTGARGEVQRYIPLSEAETTRQAALIARTGENAPAASKPTSMLIFPDLAQAQGGDAPAASDAPTSDAGGPAPGDESDSGPGSAPGEGAPGGFKRGGPVRGSSAEHAITAQEGEYVINRDAVKKYGQPLFDALNSGAALSTNSNDMLQHFAQGGRVGDGSRFAAFVAKLKSQGKSEESAEGIAASAGRAKYGKTRFQAMAAAGRKQHSLAS